MVDLQYDVFVSVFVYLLLCTASTDCPCLTALPERLRSTLLNDTCQVMAGEAITGQASSPEYCYPVDYGIGKCSPWDEFLQPHCVDESGQQRFDRPIWCTNMWCYVDAANCELPAGLERDLTASPRDPLTSDANGEPCDTCLTYSYSACGQISNYAKFRRTALMTASEIVPVIEGYVAGLRDYVEEKHMVIRSTEGETNCDYMDGCDCQNCITGQGSWANPMETYAYKISMSMSVVHPGGTQKNSLAERQAQCLARLVEGQFKRITRLEYNDPTRMGWLMYGDQASAVWYGFPGIAWCPTADAPYDPRFRPWYVSAVSGPKDVVIVLDRSNSMTADSGGESRWTRAVQAAKAVLKTLTLFDYAAIVTFHTLAEVFSPDINSLTTHLLSVTDENLDKMSIWLDDLYPMGGTNFKAGFTKAFDVIDNTGVHTSDCNGVMLFLTDGIDTSGVSLEEIRALNTRQFSIFTYSFGSGADATLPKAIACNNNGIWYHVPDGANVGNVMASYYEYYVGEMATHKQIRWTMYKELSTENPLITGCLPAFDRSVEPAKLLGVVCMDASIIIGVPELMQKADYADSVRIMENQARQCYPVRHNEEMLEKLRGDVSEHARCSVTSTGMGTEAPTVNSEPDRMTANIAPPRGLGVIWVAALLALLHTQHVL